MKWQLIYLKLPSVGPRFSRTFFLVSILHGKNSTVLTRSLPLNSPFIHIDDESNFSLSEIYSIYKPMIRGKAFGKDALPPDVYCAFADQIARLALPLYRHAFASVSEPLQFKGGVIQDLLGANGFSVECSNSRGILVSEILGEGYRRGFRIRLSPF